MRNVRGRVRGGPSGLQKTKSSQSFHKVKIVPPLDRRVLTRGILNFKSFQIYELTNKSHCPPSAALASAAPEIMTNTALDVIKRTSHDRRPHPSPAGLSRRNDFPKLLTNDANARYSKGQLNPAYEFRFGETFS
ncbi:hypothetical protein EVAR_61628_1 [Eumeta japonica]|uniref:Uncharacterized protein n=1 Tax=Eumeta variegata TaxID=151549 RepID=A0A4C1ZLC2_EUMVA|nr:hypothetical protein EVAR_61628_1 [Eumeta japonica]